MERRILPEDFEKDGHYGHIYDLLRHIRQKTNEDNITKYTFMTIAKSEFGESLSDIVVEAIEMLLARNVDVESTVHAAKVIKKHSVVQELRDLLEQESKDVESAEGSIYEIVGGIEDRLFHSFNSLGSDEDVMVNIAEKAFDFAKGLVGAPSIGLDLGFPNWQRTFGKIRNGSVHGIFARMKQGKSQLALQLAVRCMYQDVPVLLLDTELGEELQMIRLVAQAARVPYEYIEEGTWVRNADMVKRMAEAEEWVKTKDFMYADISGQSLQEASNCIRKFALKYNRNPGITPQCLVLYDYIKLPDIGMLASAAEHQILGAVTSRMHDEALKLRLPIFVVGQQNRSGEESDSNTTIADSDKIGRDLDSMTLIRRKTEREFANDPRENGTHMLKVMDCRSGAGHVGDEYINLHFDMSCGVMSEGEEFTYEKLQFLRNQVKEE
jgi:replicative DNA helicase